MVLEHIIFPLTLVLYTAGVIAYANYKHKA